MGVRGKHGARAFLVVGILLLALELSGCLPERERPIRGIFIFAGLAWLGWTRRLEGLVVALFCIAGLSIGAALGSPGWLLGSACALGLAGLTLGAAQSARIGWRPVAPALLFAVAAALMGPSGGSGGASGWLQSLGLSEEQIMDLLFFLRKGIHVLGYAALAAAAAIALPPQSKKRLSGAAGWTLCLACADELYQSFFPAERTGQLSDVFIDCAGIAFGLAALQYGIRRRRTMDA
jgi:hypothetical protein